MDLELRERVAVVTGGSEGIGRAAAARMAAEGAHVVICGRRQGALEEAAAAIGADAGGTVTPVVADVTRPDDVRALFAAAAAAHGGVDILVNNAGTAAAARFTEVDDAAWQRDLELKLFGAIRCCREAIPLMQRRGGGSIVNLSTPGGKAPPPGTLPTSVSRAAGISLTKALSQEHAADNIRVNAVCIGLVKSGQNDRRFEARRREEPDLTRERFYAEEAAGIPLGRVGESEEAGDVIAFLASARAAYVTGVTVNVDGGAAPVV